MYNLGGDIGHVYSVGDSISNKFCSYIWKCYCILSEEQDRLGRALLACIVNNSNYTNGSGVYGIFKVVMVKSLNRQEKNMKGVNYIKLKNIYEVGEYCGIDGRLWSVLVEDNKDSLKNIKGVLLEHYQKELDILLEVYQDDLGANDYIMLVKGYIDEYKELITKIKAFDSIEQLSYIKLEENYRYILVKKVEVIS